MATHHIQYVAIRTHTRARQARRRPATAGRSDSLPVGVGELRDHRLELRYPEQHHVEKHYQEHQDKAFFEPLVEYLTDSPVVATVLSGTDAVNTTRRIIGDTDPATASAETIRGELGTDSMEQADAEGRALQNLVHASADPADAAREISLWFPDHESVE